MSFPLSSNQKPNIARIIIEIYQEYLIKTIQFVLCSDVDSGSCES